MQKVSQGSSRGDLSLLVRGEEACHHVTMSHDDRCLRPSRLLPLMAEMVKNLPAVQVPSLGLRRSLEEDMTTHSDILAWRIPWAEEPGWL